MKKLPQLFSPAYFWNHLSTDVISAYQFCQVIRYIQNVLLSIALVHSGMNLSEIGSFEILVFLVTLFSQFWVSGFKEGLISGSGQLPAKEKENWIIHSFSAHIILGLVFAVLLMIFGPLYLNYESDTDSANLLWLCALFLVLQALGNVVETILLIRQRSQLLFFSGLVSGALFIVLLLTFFWLTPELTSLLILLIIFYGLKSVFTFLLIKIKWGDIIHKNSFHYIKWSVPFLSISVLGYGMEALDGFLVIHFFDDSTFPLYKYGARELPLSALLMSSLSVALIPVLAQNEALADLRKRADFYMHLMFPLTIIMIWVSSFLFSFVYGKDFLISAQVFNIYLLIIGSRLLMPHSILMARGKEKIVMWSGVAELICNICLSLLLYVFWGLIGLVFATVLSYYFHKLFLMWFSYKYFRIQLKDLINTRWWFFYQCIAFISVLISIL